MKNQLIGISLFAATVSAVAFYPADNANNQLTINSPANAQPLSAVAATITARPQIEVVFVLDTTSSMSGFIDAAKEKIWSIATTMASAQPSPEIKIGLVAFRDRGDAYVTQVTDLSTDLDSVYAKLMDYKAQGGGDGPESVNKALFDAVNNISWKEDKDTYKVVFLVGDAAPHMDYQGEVQYPETLRIASAKGIRVNTIQSGDDRATTKAWQHIAGLNQGDFFNVATNGSAVAVATPFDKKIADLSKQLDETRLFFGDAEQRRVLDAKHEASKKVHASASVSSRARRAAFNNSASGAMNLYGESELVEAVVAGKLDLDSMEEDAMPVELQALAPAARKATVARRAEERESLVDKIRDLAKDRDDFIAAEIESKGGADDSLDEQLYDTVKRQTAELGLRYDAPAKY